VTQDFVEKHYRHNFIANTLDGAFFTLGLAFFSASTILPLYIRHLADAPWLISLIPAITQAGWFLPQLLTARQVGLRARRLPYVMAMSANERFPVLLLGLSILLWPNIPASAALAVFFLLLTWQTVGGGLTAPGWVDVVARVTPVNRRGRLFGITNFVGSVWGVAGAIVAGFYLQRFPYPQGFAYIFITGAVCFLASWAFLGQVREPLVENLAKPQPRRDYWRSLPAVLRSDPNLQRYLLARVPAILGLAANGFLAVYAVQRFNLPDAAAAGYTAALMITGAIINPVVGVLGDRFGHKLVMELSFVAQGLSLLVALLARRPEWFYLVFVLQGIQSGAGMIASLGLMMEFGRPEERPTVVALANTAQGLIFLIAPPLAGILAGMLGYRAAFWAALVATGLGLVTLRLTVREPRYTPAPGALEAPAP
jgi:MFS family permease